MRLYLQDINPNIFTPDQLPYCSSYCDMKKVRLTYIYSDSGILLISNNKLNYIYYNDDETELVTVLGHSAIIDKSKQIKSNNSFQIPVPNTEVDIICYEFMEKTCKEVKFILEFSNDKCTDCYFESQCNNSVEFVNKVVTLLDKLKLY